MKRAVPHRLEICQEGKFLTPSEEIERGLKALLSQGKYDEAEEKARSESWPQDLEGQRRKFHALGLCFLNQGRFKEALENFESARDRGGENLLLLLDLAAAQGSLLQLPAWRKTYRLIERKLAREKNLSLRTRIFACLILSKFLEEDGNIVQADTLLEEGIKILDSMEAHLLSGLYSRLKANQLRLRAQLMEREGLASLYKETLSFWERNPSVHTDVEVLHSLMQMEISLFGINSGLTRLRRIFDDSRVGCYDQGFFILDFIEASLLSKAELDLSILAQIPSTYPLSRYESLLIDFAQGKISLGWEEVQQLVQELPLAQYLKICWLFLDHHSHSLDPKQREEICSHLRLLIQSLDPESAHHWLARSQGRFEKSQSQILKVLTSEMAVEGLGKKVFLKHRSILFELLKSLASEDEVSLEAVCSQLWDASYNESYFHRIRISLNRLGKLMEPVLPGGRPFIIKNGKVIRRLPIRFILE